MNVLKRLLGDKPDDRSSSTHTCNCCHKCGRLLDHKGKDDFDYESILQFQRRYYADKLSYQYYQYNQYRPIPPKKYYSPTNLTRPSGLIDPPETALPSETSANRRPPNQRYRANSGVQHTRRLSQPTSEAWCEEQPNQPTEPTTNVCQGKVKYKVKTRPVRPDCEGEADPKAPVDNTSRGSASDGSSSMTRVVISRTSKELLTRLFMASPPSKKSIRFEDFVGAMVDAGFKAEHGRKGSTVVFKSASGTFSVHRPHPDSRVDPYMLRCWGKRLNKKFGWQEDSFVERVRGRCCQE